MNVYEAIRHYLTNSMYNEAGDESRIALGYLLNAYDALAPDWANAPEWAQWYAIDADGEAAWYREEPHSLGRLAAMWGPITLRLYNAPIVTIPDHIDWRDCKWSRPEAA